MKSNILKRETLLFIILISRYRANFDSIPIIHSNRNTITTTNCEKPCFPKKKRKKFFCHKISIRTIKRKNENKILAGKRERSNIKINAKGVKN